MIHVLFLLLAGWGLTIPESVTNIGHTAFSSTAISTIRIPQSVSTIGEGAFHHMPFLEAIQVDSLNAFYRSIDGVLFNYNASTLIQYPDNKTTPVYTVPEGVIKIDNYAFTFNWDLTELIMSDTVTSVGDGAFQNCRKLNKITFGRNFASFGALAFAGKNDGRCFFKGNAPEPVSNFPPFWQCFYLPGTLGWETFSPQYFSPWVLSEPQILITPPNFGVKTNSFGFVVSWATSGDVVIEAAPNLDQPNWVPLSTNLLSDGWAYFSDGQSAQVSNRVYRVRRH